MRSNIQTKQAKQRNDTAPAKKIKRQLQNNKEIEKCAMQCGVIGDKTKLKICFLLKNYPELDVTQIAELVGTSVSNASHSLARLKAAGLVAAERRGKFNYYSLNNGEFGNLIKTLGG